MNNGLNHWTRVVVYIAIIVVAFGLSRQWMAVTQGALGGFMLGATFGIWKTKQKP